MFGFGPSQGIYLRLYISPLKNSARKLEHHLHLHCVWVPPHSVCLYPKLCPSGLEAARLQISARHITRIALSNV